MGFCRRCGDIVSGSRCKCGGAPVEAGLQWNQGGVKKPATDRWSQTYVARQSSQQRAPAPTPNTPAPAAQTFHRFPKPVSARVSAHIASTISSRPTSPLKYSSTLDDEVAAEADILPVPTGNGSELAKVYGSVLQSKDTLDSYHCHSCLTRFSPDATLYPDPSDKLGARFFCRNCFVENGGSRGDCGQCHRPVLILKSEGGFVENSGQVWHKRCFSCSGCGKSIGDNPMVDLLGNPSCAACFETCLIRGDDSLRSRRTSAPTRTPTSRDMDNLGGTRLDSSLQSRQSSPALEELEHRLGIRSRETTPAKELASPQPLFPISSTKIPGSPDLGRDQVSSYHASDAGSRRKSYVSEDVDVTPASPHTRVTESGSPIRRSRTPRSSLISISTPSPKPTQDAIEEMKRRFLRQDSPSPGPDTFSDDILQRSSTSRQSIDLSGSPFRSTRTSTTTFARRRSSSFVGLHSEIPLHEAVPSTSIPPKPLTPDLMSDASDTTLSSAPSTPPPETASRNAKPRKLPAREEDDIFQEATPAVQSNARKSQPGRSSLTPGVDATCADCSLPLFNLNSVGRYVTVPEPSATGGAPRVYHADCFRCRICDGVFEEKERGQAVFVRGVRGACHLECAPPEKMTIRSVTNSVYNPPATIASTGPKITKAEARKASPSISTQSSRVSVPLRSAPSTQTMFGRFGSTTSCPGCRQSVSPMERGVVPGPQGTRWHGSCLICGGREARGRHGRRRDGKPGCGKQLDSSAKHDAEERGVWCRECLLLMPPSPASPQIGPIRAVPLKSTSTGNSVGAANIFPKLAAQTTGTTTIARQFTGMSGGADAALIRQTTGGGLSPTRQLTGNSTKGIYRQHTGGSTTSGSHIRPRPKSVIGMRDEGRGMFLVKQMTGGAL